MQTTIQRPRPIGQMIRPDSKVNAITDGCGNLTTAHPAIKAQVEADSRKFRQITDLKAGGLI
jgi:hypothetical protein